MPTLTAAQVAERGRKLLAGLNDCELCPRRCDVDRTRDKLGFCRIGRQAKVSSFGPHYGEERPLVGRGGSGTVFFAGCNLACVFCQNDDISHGLAGRPVDDEQLAAIFLSVQENGCENLNLVTPTHVVAQCATALALAMERGFTLPLVYNTGGYDGLEMLRLLDGVVDIYMPDLKFMDSGVATRLAAAPDYPVVATQAIREMHRQVGDLQIDARGVADRGLLVRHLVMPNDLAGTKAAMAFLAEQVSRNTYVNVMGQYHPCYQAFQHDDLRRRPTREEMEQAFEAARNAGLTRLD